MISRFADEKQFYFWKMMVVKATFWYQNKNKHEKIKMVRDKRKEKKRLKKLEEIGDRKISPNTDISKKPLSWARQEKYQLQLCLLIHLV